MKDWNVIRTAVFDVYFRLALILRLMNPFLFRRFLSPYNPFWQGFFQVV